MNPIKDARESLSLTQAQLAEAANVSRRYIVSLEQLIPEEVPLDVLIVLTPSGNPADRSTLARLYARAYRDKDSPLTLALQRRGILTAKEQDAILATLPYVRINPHKWLREHLCKYYGLPGSQIKYTTFTPVTPSVLQAYEALPFGSGQLMPKQLRTTLIAMFHLDGAVVDLVETLIKSGARNG